jgi:hypothetical protein
MSIFTFQRVGNERNERRLERRGQLYVADPDEAGK